MEASGGSTLVLALKGVIQRRTRPRCFPLVPGEDRESLDGGIVPDRVAGGCFSLVRDRDSRLFLPARGRNHQAETTAIAVKWRLLRFLPVRSNPGLFEGATPRDAIVR